MKIQDVKRQRWEQGTKQGLEEGVRGGEMEGPATAVAMEPRGTEGPVSCGLLGLNDSNTRGPSKYKRTRLRESKVLLLLLPLLRPKLTYTLQKKERIQMKSRSSLEVRNGWMSMYEVKTPALVRIVIEDVRSAIFPILIGRESHHRFGYDHLRWITHPYHGQGQQSRSSRRSDPTTTRGKPTPILQQSPGRAEIPRALRKPFLRLDRPLVQRLCKPLVDLRRFSVLL